MSLLLLLNPRNYIRRAADQRHGKGADKKKKHTKERVDRVLDKILPNKEGTPPKVYSDDFYEKVGSYLKATYELDQIRNKFVSVLETLKKEQTEQVLKSKADLVAKIREAERYRLEEARKVLELQEEQDVIIMILLNQDDDYE